tara:strand:- start:336 stop:578 length:243 start_codon:yes stop_codon:yes gene_type:complete
MATTEKRYRTLVRRDSIIHRIEHILVDATDADIAKAAVRDNPDGRKPLRTREFVDHVDFTAVAQWEEDEPAENPVDEIPF